MAWLGIHLSLLREHPACGTGQYGLDAGPGHVAGIVAMVAVPTLLVNLFGVLGMIGIWVTLRMLPAKAINAVRRLWPRLPRIQRCLRLEHRPASAPRPPAQPLRPWQLDACPALRRGPPIPLGF